MVVLRRWWTTKYKLPWSEFNKQVEDVLWVEFYEDIFAEDPAAALEMDSSVEDDVQFVTGDAEFDRVERMIANGASDEEIQAVVDQWDKGGPAQNLPPGFELQDDFDDFEGFEDVSPLVGG